MSIIRKSTHRVLGGLFGLSLFIAASTALADIGGLGPRCGQELRAANPLVETAVRNLTSFESVHTAFGELRAQDRDVRFCVSGVMLSKNIYQYGRFLIAIEAINPAGRATHRFYFLYQDASVQAIHNVGRRPYIALPRRDVDQILTEARAGAADLTRELPFEDVIQGVRASRTYTSAAPESDPTTMSGIAVPSEDGSARELFVTWMTRTPANPFAGYALLKGVSVDLSGANSGATSGSGKVTRLVEFRPFSQLLTARLDPLQDKVQSEVAAAGLSDAQAARKILDESKL